MGANFELFLENMLSRGLSAVSPPMPDRVRRRPERAQPLRRDATVRRIGSFGNSMLAYEQGASKMVAVAKSCFSADDEEISNVFPGLVTMASRIKCDYCALTVTGWLTAEIEDLDAFHADNSPSCPAILERAERRKKKKKKKKKAAAAESEEEADDGARAGDEIQAVQDGDDDDDGDDYGGK